MKSDLVFNRYALRIYQKGRTYKGLKRYLYWLFGGIATVIKHPNLWGYLEDIEKNNYVIELKDKSAKLWIPNCKTDYIERIIARDADFYAREDLDYICQKYLCQPGMRILDIGANIGNHTVYYSKVVKAKKVYSFEPQRNMYAILERNIAINGLGDIVESHNVALGNEKGKIDMVSDVQNNSGAAHVVYGGSGEIDICRLDDFNLENIDFVKIDVEGFEYNVLLGAKELFINQNLVVLLEIFKENFEKTNALLEEYGYYVVEDLAGDDYVYMKKK